MNRRDLLKYLLMTPAATFVDYEKLLWVPGEKKIFVPEVLPIDLYGIPYHESNDSSGIWLGVVRVPLNMKLGGLFTHVYEELAHKNELTGKWEGFKKL